MFFKRLCSSYIPFKSSNMSVFVQKLNPLTGINDWVVQNEDYDYHQEVARAAFADMLHDTERNQLYELALKAAIDKVHSQGKEAKVLDIGTGTGLLAMMAARHGADKIYACEAFKPMSDCAKKIINMNLFENKITLIPKRSTELVVGKGCDMEERCNILVTEVFDTELIGEGALSTFSHANKVLLEKNSIVVPESATVFVQIVECPLAQRWNKCTPISRDNNIIVNIPKTISNCAGSASVHDIQLTELPIESFKTLVPPVPVLHFDWSGKNLLKNDEVVVKKLKSQTDGIAQCVFMWWELKMDTENKFNLSCAPIWAHPLTKLNEQTKHIPWRDHWMQAVYYFPQEVRLQKDEEFNLFSCHDEYSLWFNISKDQNVNELLERPICECGLHLGFSRTRIGQINDPDRQNKYFSLLEKKVNGDSCILVLGDCFIHSLAAAKFGAKKIYLLETNYISNRIMKDLVDCNQLDTEITLINSLENFSQMDLADVNMILAEPYFTSSILPWDNLLFLYIIKGIKKLLPKEVQTFPQRAIIKAVVVQFKDLFKIREPLGKCEGFLMEEFDNLIKESSNISDDNVEAQPLWEYPGIALSQEVKIATIDFGNIDDADIEAKGNIIIERDLPCNGIALWMDWVLDEKENLTISTGPVQPIKVGENISWDMHTRQGVCLFSNVKKHSINYVFEFKINEGNISFKHS